MQPTCQTPDETYDSRPDTLDHIRTVQEYLARVVFSFHTRMIYHDKSKLESPEREVFDEFTPKLKGSTYGSEEYRQFLEHMRPALEHHYANNSHHPEHFGYLECAGCFKRWPKDFLGPCDRCGYTQLQLRPDVKGMSLLDLTEMLCDWKAATLRHADGDLRRSIEINQERFEYSDEMKSILLNTAIELGLTE
jgi:hypothetical protein